MAPVVTPVAANMTLPLANSVRPYFRPRSLMPILRARLLSFGMILGIGFVLMVSLVFSAGMAALSRWWDPVFGEWETIAHSIDVAVGILLSTAVFGLIFKTMPRVAVAWKDVWIGAAVTSLLFVAGKFAIGAWLGHSGVSSLFGAAASFVVVMLWVYYSAQVFLLGAEFTRAWAGFHGSESAAAAMAEPVHGRGQRAHRTPPTAACTA